MWPNTALTQYLNGPDMFNKSGRNFQRENLRHIKSLQIENKKYQQDLKEEQLRKRKPLKATLAISEQVKSKVRPMMRHGSSSLSSQNSNYLLSHAKSGPFDKDGKVLTNRTNRSSLKRAQSLELPNPSKKCETWTQWDPDNDELDLKDDEEVVSTTTTRFSEVTVEERKSRISDIINEILSSRPLIEGRGLSRSASSINLLDTATNKKLSAKELTINHSVRRRKFTDEKSVQTEGAPEVSLICKSVLSSSKNPQSIRSKSLSNVQLNKLNYNQPKIDSSSIKSLKMKKMTKENGFQTESKENRINNIELDAKTKEELKLNLDGIEGSLAESQINTAINYIHANKDSASLYGNKKRNKVQESQRSRNQKNTETSKVPSSYKVGNVPQYIKERKAYWKEQERIKEASKPDPNCPPGHILLTTDEKKAKLQEFNEKIQKLVNECNSFPVRADTFRIRERRRQIETELNELEEEIRKFSRPKVYIKKD